MSHSGTGGNGCTEWRKCDLPALGRDLLLPISPQSLHILICLDYLLPLPTPQVNPFRRFRILCTIGNVLFTLHEIKSYSACCIMFRPVPLVTACNTMSSQFRSALSCLNLFYLTSRTNRRGTEVGLNQRAM